ncbi:MAG: SMP-30/gluconolactonase/LRE family protein [Acidobacteriota bacterium]|nr:SMP-30/gluconolactonase/LRE family protein [Acidobacteriota bacterium]
MAENKRLAKEWSAKIAVIVFLLLSQTFALAQNERRYPWQYFWQQSLAAYKNKDYSSFLENSRKAVESGPINHPTLFYNIARAYSLTGNKTEAVKWLEKTLNLGFGAEAIAGDDFTFLRDAPEYTGVRKRIEAVRKPKVKSKTATTILEPDLIPESVAYDAAEKTFYVGSLYKQKIVKIDRRGQKSDFVTEGSNGLGAVVGIKIDAARKVLWALNNIAPEMKTFDKTREGVGMLHKYELETGRLIKKYELSNQPRPHFLNDLVVTESGDLYITDSLASVVHILRAEKDEPEIFANLEPFSYPNGIALSKDESKLYVATLNGVSIVDAKNGKSKPLAHGETIALAGIDGLYFYENSLIAIQNFESPNRVVRFELNESGDRILKAEVLESNHPLYKIPTTGAIDGRNFYYIANSQLRSFDESGKILPLDKLQNITILKLSL